MKIVNNSPRRVSLPFRDGRTINVPESDSVILPDSDFTFLDDTAATLALFSSGVLTLQTTGGGAWAGPALPALPNQQPSPMLTPVLVDERGQTKRADNGQPVGGGVPGLVNWKKSNTRQIAAAMLGAQAGDLSSRMIVGQDSMGAGTGSTNNILVNARSKSWPRLFAEQLVSRGVVAYDTWAGGNGSNGANLATYLSYDPRVAFGSSSSLDGTWWGVAGQAWRLGSDTVNSWIELTPQKAFDTVDVVHHVASGTGIFRMLDQASVQAGANINTVAGTNGAAETTITFPAGSTKARAVWVSTNLVLLSGMGTRIASERGIEVINTSISGIETSFFNANGGNDWAAHRAALPVMFGARTAGRNVYILGGGYNDMYVGGVSLETVKSRMRSRINYLRTLTNAPDIVALGYPRLGTQTAAAQIALNDALRGVAVDEYDLPFVDAYSITEDAAAAIAKGFLSADRLHMRAAYQGLLAKTVLGGFELAAALQA